MASDRKQNGTQERNQQRENWNETLPVRDNILRTRARCLLLWQLSGNPFQTAWIESPETGMATREDNSDKEEHKIGLKREACNLIIEYKTLILAA